MGNSVATTVYGPIFLTFSDIFPFHLMFGSVQAESPDKPGRENAGNRAFFPVFLSGCTRNSDGQMLIAASKTINLAHFLLFFPLAGVSTITASSSAAPSFVESLSSFIKSDEIWPLLFSHHCFSASFCASISLRRSRSLVLAAISCADWNMVGPQFGARALALKQQQQGN